VDTKHFSAGQAITHFLHTEGPRGFLPRFALAYGFLSLLIQIPAYWLQGPVYAIYLRAFTENNGDFTPYVDELNRASLQANLGSLIALPLSLAIWAVFEAASQRRYLRGEAFRLRIGADEGRLAVVGLIWFAFLVVAYFALVIALVIPAVIAGFVAGIPGAVVVGGVIFLALMIAGTYFFARFSGASALTVREGQIRFFESWALTRGLGWKLTGAFLALFVMFTVIVLILYAGLGAAGFGLVWPSIDGESGSALTEKILAAVAQPGFWGPMLFLLFLVMSVYGVFAHAFAGPGAWLVRQRASAHLSVIGDTFG
jgi:hypothetical protein